MKKGIQLVTLFLVLFGSLGCFRAKNFEERVNRITEKLKQELSLNAEQAEQLERIRLEIINKQESIKKI